MGNKQASKAGGKTKKHDERHSDSAYRAASNGIGERDIINARSLLSHAPAAPAVTQTALVHKSDAAPPEIKKSLDDDEEEEEEDDDEEDEEEEEDEGHDNDDEEEEDDDEEEDHGPCVVIDNGSAMIRAGFAGRDGPRAVFPSIVGRPPSTSCETRRKDVYIGDEAQAKRGILNLVHPIEDGIIQSWDHMETLWKHTFYNELRVAPEEHPVLLTDAPMTPKANREKMTQIMFEALSVPAMHVITDAALSLYTSGRTTGVVVDSGHGVSHTVPVCEGSVVAHGIQRMGVAGKALTDYMSKLLNEAGYSLTTTAELEVVAHIKETLCHVSLNYDDDMRKFAEESESNKTYELPDGRTIKVTNQRFRCPEALFNPFLVNSEDEGLPETLCRSAEKTFHGHHDRTKFKWEQKDFWQHIVLSGGSTLFPGMRERLHQKLTTICPTICPYSMIDFVKVANVGPNTVYSVWIGGSILASLDTFKAMMITQDEFHDVGDSIVHRKCF